MQFNIIEYMKTLTGYSQNMDESVLKRIAMERGVSDVTEYEKLGQKEKDLIQADILFIAYTSPYQTSSHTKQHGAFSQTIGSQIITDKKGLLNMIIAYYKKWNDEKLEIIKNFSGNLRWINYSEDD